MSSERIESFNEKIIPFYIVDVGGGKYSLCLPLDFLKKEYQDKLQEPFNCYAKEIGEPSIIDGLYTHGNGYEWQTVFKKAFEKDENLNRITFDCELGGFFCGSNDLELLEDFGQRFHDICNDSEQFIQLVSDALKESAILEESQNEDFTMTM